MSFTKMGEFTDDFTALPTKVSGQAELMKTRFNRRGDELKTVLNGLIDDLEAADDGASGSDSIGMTPIAETGTASTVQAVIEALVTRLKAVTDSASGADLIGATAISGLTGATVQALLEALNSEKASSSDITNLAGAGRTTETVKDNADAIATMKGAGTLAEKADKSVVDAHLADYAQDTGVANAYVITLSPAPTAYEIGKIYKFKAVNTNTGASTFQVGALTATAIKKNVTTDLVAGEITAGQIVMVVYDGTNFQLLSIKDLSSLLTAAGDIIYASASHTPARLAKGTDGQVLTLSSGLPIWCAGTKIVSGSYVGNDVTGRLINIGSAPKIVIISPQYTGNNAFAIGIDGNGMGIYETGTCRGLSTDNSHRPTLTANGFTVSATDGSIKLNQTGTTYNYVALMLS